MAFNFHNPSFVKLIDFSRFTYGTELNPVVKRFLSPIGRLKIGPVG